MGVRGRIYVLPARPRIFSLGARPARLTSCTITYNALQYKTCDASEPPVLRSFDVTVATAGKMIEDSISGDDHVTYGPCRNIGLPLLFVDCKL